jgi:hypothetical protein
MISRSSTGTLPVLPSLCHQNRAEPIARTVEFFPHYGKMPQLSSADAAIRAAIDLCWTLHNPAPASPLTSIGDAQMDAIQKLADIFDVAAAHPAPTKHTPAPSPASAALPRVGFQPTPHSLSPAPHTIEPETLPTPLPPSHSTPNRRSPRLHAHHIIPPDSSAYAATNLVPSHLQNPCRDNRRICAQIMYHSGRLGLHGNPEGHAWLKTGWPHCQ